MHSMLRVLMVVMGVVLVAVSYAVMRRITEDEDAITEIHQDADRTSHDLLVMLLGNVALFFGFVAYTVAAIYDIHDLFVFGEGILLVYLGVPVILLAEWWRRLR